MPGAPLTQEETQRECRNSGKFSFGFFVDGVEMRRFSLKIRQLYNEL